MVPNHFSTTVCVESMDDSIHTIRHHRVLDSLGLVRNAYVAHKVAWCVYICDGRKFCSFEKYLVGV